MNFKSTLVACCIAYITQAIIINLPPLFFIVFREDYGLSFDQISVLILINFCTQIVVDLVVGKYSIKWGVRRLCVLCHFISVAGLLLYSIITLVPNASIYGILLLATILCAIGGGMLEVLISPIVESLPSDCKSGAMALLHSFYCWGQVLTVLLTTVFFFLTKGTHYWYIAPILWAIVPFVNAFVFMRVPLLPLSGETAGTKMRHLILNPMMILFVLAMMCAGASELAIAQWASLFAEKGLNIGKMVGDIAGPCAFAILMGTSRTLFATVWSHINLHKALLVSSVLCVASYLVMVFSNSPIAALIACSASGFSVGLMWPGTISCAVERFPVGGPAMFALLACAGDIGCALGPAVVGWVGDSVEATSTSFLTLFVNAPSIEALALRSGIAVAAIFPLLLIIFVLIMKQKKSAR
jgi:MFS family permease